MRIRPYLPSDKRRLIELWKDCRLINPKNDPARDIRRKLKVNPEWLLVGVTGGEVVGSVMIGYEGHRGWINYLAVSPRHRNQGFGNKLLLRAEKELKKAGCPKINLQVRKGNEAVLGFYRKMGYVEDDVVSLGKRLRDDSK